MHLSYLVKALAAIAVVGYEIYASVQSYKEQF
jgi:hypothetical protein